MNTDLMCIEKGCPHPRLSFSGFCHTHRHLDAEYAYKHRNDARSRHPALTPDPTTEWLVHSDELQALVEVTGRVVLVRSGPEYAPIGTMVVDLNQAQIQAGLEACVPMRRIVG